LAVVATPARAGPSLAVSSNPTGCIRPTLPTAIRSTVRRVTDLTVNDVRVFVPAREFEVSRAFYLALGWTELWADGSLSLLEIADRRFMLQDYFVEQWAHNFMMTVEVA